MSMHNDKRILVISDTHGRDDGLEDLIKLVNPACIYHLGDSQDDCFNIERIASRKGVMLEAVAGNCDWGSSLPKNVILSVGDSRVLLTHGHLYSAKSSYYGLIEAAQNNDCDVVLFGHTHHAIKEEMHGVTLFNPGSWSLPEPGMSGSYGVLIIREDGSVDLEIRYRKN